MSEKTIPKLTPEQFQQWKEHPVTVYILQFLTEYRDNKLKELKDLSLSKFLNNSPQELQESQVKILAMENYFQGLTSLIDLEHDGLVAMESEQ